MDDRKEILQLLKKNAPVIWQQLASRKIYKINSQISELRSEYKTAETPEKKKQILQRANELKEELKLYQDTKPAGPPVQKPTEKVQTDGGSKDSSG